VPHDVNRRAHVKYQSDLKDLRATVNAFLLNISDQYIQDGQDFIAVATLCKQREYIRESHNKKRKEE